MAGEKLAPDVFAFPEVAAPGTPDVGYVYVYAKSDGKMYRKDDTGLESPVGHGFPTSSELTISSGAITVTQGYHRVDTESDAASDNLDTINGLSAGQTVILTLENAARVVTIRHNGGGTGNIRSFDASDIVLDATYKTVSFIYDGTTVNLIGR